MGAIVFQPSGTMNMASESNITLLLILSNARIHVSFSNSSNMTSYIKTFVNKAFSLPF